MLLAHHLNRLLRAIQVELIVLLALLGLTTLSVFTRCQRAERLLATIAHGTALACGRHHVVGAVTAKATVLGRVACTHGAKIE